MATFIKTRLVKIGNSQGIRIPKPLMEQVGLTGEVEMEVQQGQLVIRPVRQARQGWDAAFQRMALQGDDRLVDAEPLVLTAWEANEWQW